MSTTSRRVRRASRREARPRRRGLRSGAVRRARVGEPLLGNASVVVIDLRTGAEVTRLERAVGQWALGAGGVVYNQPGSEGPARLCPLAEVRRHAPGDAAGVAVPGARACGFYGLLGEEGGQLHVVSRSPDRRFEARAVDPLTGAGRTLARFASYALDGDAEHLAVSDPDCRSSALRVIALADAPVGPAGPRRCPLRFRVPARVRAGQPIAVRLRCPVGCRARVSYRGARPDELAPPPPSRLVRVRGRRTVRLRVRPELVRRGRLRVVVDALDPVGRRGFVRDVRVERVGV